jgi:hypothetical protein
VSAFDDKEHLMRLGILADIHEAVEPLTEALAFLRDEQVDQIITLGDICAMGTRLTPTVQLLAGASVGGVWVDHDYGLCRQHPGVSGDGQLSVANGSAGSPAALNRLAQGCWAAQA